MSDDKRVDVEFGAKIGGLVSGAREAAATVRTTTDQMKSHVAGLTSVVEGLKAPFIAVSAILAGGAIFGEAIRDAADLGEHLQVLSQKTGVQASELSRLEYAAKLADTGVENLDAGLVKMARFMGEAAKGTGDAADTATRLGISVKDAEGKLRPMRDVLLDVAEKFSHMKDGAGKSALAMEIFGKAGTSMIPMLNQGAAGIEKLEQEADRLGVTMSNEAAQAAADYGDAMDRLHGMMQGVARSIVLSIMPAFTDVANALTSIRNASGGAESSFHPLAATIRTVAAAAFELAAALHAAYQWARVVAVIMEGPTSLGWVGRLKKVWQDAADSIESYNQKMAAAVRTVRGEGPHEPAAQHQSKDAPDPKTKPAKTGSDERIAAWKDELRQIQQIEELGKDTLLVDEISFWQKKLALVQGNSKADVKLRQQINAEILAADKQLHADEQRAAAIRAQIQRDTQIEELDVERRAIEERRALHEIDAQEAERELIALNERVTAIKIAALEEQRALAVGDMVKQAEIDQQLAALKRTSAREVADIHKQTTVEIAKDWEGVFDHVSNVFSQSVTAIINGTQTLRGALKGIFQNIVLDFAASKLKELQHHVAVELAKRGITTATAAHKLATEGAAAVKSLAITAATTLKAIAMHAVHAMAAAWAAISAIPIVGPVLAPIVAGATLAAVLGLGSRIASAEGGYDIPAGVNPMTQLHAQEMVLPARLANVVRAMAESGASSGAGALPAPSTSAGVPAPSNVEHHYHIHTLDAKSLRDYLRANPAALADGVQAAVRSGHLARTS
jgi:hypothetical protein